MSQSNGPSFVQKIHQVFYDDFLLEFTLALKECQYAEEYTFGWTESCLGICQWNFAQVDS